MKINNLTLLILFGAMILAAFLPQWFMATSRDHTEVTNGVVSAALIAAILGVLKMAFTGRP